MARRPPDPRWDLYQEHLDETAFLLAQRAWMLEAPDMTLADARDGEEARIRAHVDGLVLGGPRVAEHLLLPALEGEEPPQVAAAALALLWAEGADHGRALVERLQAATPEQRAGLTLAFELAGRHDLAPSLGSLLASPDPGAVAAAVRSLTRLGIPLGAALRALLAHEAPEVVMAALDAAEAFGALDQADWIVHRMTASETAVRDAAIRAGLGLGLRAGLDLARHLAAARDPGAAGALLPLGLAATPADVSALCEAARGTEALRPAALFALGFSGRVAAADLCCELMADEEVAPLCGEAFSAITGLVIAGPFAAGAEEPEEPIPLEEEDLEEPAGLRPEDRLPVPEAAAVTEWWKAARGHFDETRRHVRGQRATAAHLAAELSGGPARRHGPLALEAAIRSAGKVRAPRWGWVGARLAGMPSPESAAFDVEGPLDKFLR